MSPAVQLRTASFADLDPLTLYQILKVRVDAFVVEQECPYPELDGRDTEPGAVHCWIEEDGEILAVARVLVDEDGVGRVGRVATRPDARGRGLAGRLVRHGTTLVEGPVRLSAQAHLADYYAALGFRRDGEEFLEDGIPHVPMILAR